MMKKDSNKAKYLGSSISDFLGLFNNKGKNYMIYDTVTGEFSYFDKNKRLIAKGIDEGIYSTVLSNYNQEGCLELKYSIVIPL